MEGSKIIEVSTSKKSIVLDRGYAEGLRNGDRAKIYTKDLSGGLEKPRFNYVAEGEVIKVKNNLSYWYLRKIKNFRFLNKNSQIVMVRQAKDPRRPFVTKRLLKVQGRSERQDYYQVSEDTGVPDDLVFEEDDFFIGENIRDTKPTKLQNIEITKKSNYVDIGDEFDESFDQVTDKLIVPGSEGDRDLINKVEKKARDYVFDSASKGSVEKYNELKYGLKGLYGGVVRDEMNANKSSSDFVNSVEKSHIENQKRKQVSPEALARIRKEGPRWSQGMDDEQLRRYLIETGIEGELRRQKRALGEKAGHEFTLRYTSNITTNTTTEDPNYQSNDYAISFSYEWHLQGTSELLKNFSAEFELERGISHYDVGGINGRITEGSIKGYLNWYFLRPPSSIGSYMPYVGLGIKRGNGDLESAEFDNIYTVQLLAFPSAHFGLKYRFEAGDTLDSQLKVGFGVNFQVKYESMRYNVVDILDDNISPVFSSNQTRFSVGLNVYF